ncbi:uncharacterized protein LOC114536328 [Dendronephthya gigantea]|uniref:uncharacterized protein LOC114536328 n=1 Tax=Dendronephthya gigantea TaxID=151771 RepID=UPI00106CEB2D|nr:uncharacterized protein LOC114536328 [Dendronephthya gigantea]XP_028413486.1 uncharacterized protein LOC114536328 [Dendronephthya gigantea]XP_028413487.1 uncharacterized protein LOC114536328 [Dendronephthya gigantea]
MKCHLCKEDKLSKEFPFYSLTDDCNHALLHCLDCSISSVKNSNKCSQCDSFVDENNKRYQQYLKTMNFLFPNEEEDEDNNSIVEMDIAEGEIKVITLSGEHAILKYQRRKTIRVVKEEVERELKTPPERQRLLYQEKELKMKDENNKELTLEDFNIPPNATLQLIIKLCDVPDDLEKLVFDFCWGLPSGTRKDYLDVAVFVYTGRSFVETIYYSNTSISECPGVIHSGPADMDYEKREGHHRVDIDLKSVPRHIDKLVFTLSAWRSSNIGKYRFRRLRFYDVNNPDVELCSDNMDTALHNESIVMCYLTRKGDKWTVLSLKHGAEGNTRSFHKTYCPLREDIQKLINRGFIS